ncbi:MAG TPA: ribonuclease HI family protein [Candidatus Paceibacterota bacterium]|nr:ribonuclease HI family protein [Candidatus Paceibacterota bacterium]HRY76607.1 ribonuclease HI family protein [Candidatus Paceibacterota bacterium]
MKKEVADKIIVNTDGGSRGNPGAAAIGAVITGIGKEIKEYSEFIGIKTNNEAEYQAIIFALKKVRQLAGRENLEKTGVEVRTDSELVARQLKGEYKVEEKNLQPLFMEIWNLRFDFPHLALKEVPREENQKADRLVNSCLDQQNSKLFK